MKTKDYLKISGLKSELLQLLKMENFILKEKLRIKNELELEGEGYNA